MRQEKWFISNLDNSQRKVMTRKIDESIVVKGVAGSGKTNLALLRALQAMDYGTYAMVILTVALRRMIAYGMEVFGLDKERIAYDWEWRNRGFAKTGDVYYNSKDPNYIYLVNDTDILCLKRVNIKDKESVIYGLDFGDWVSNYLYSTYGRRTSWFAPTTDEYHFDINNKEKFIYIPSGILYSPQEKAIDYIIVDEAQDFSSEDIKKQFLSMATKSLSLFGDSAQQMNARGSSIEDIAQSMGFNTYLLKFNYRMPISIAKVAQQITDKNINLIGDNRKEGGNTDYPNYPKPVVAKYNDREEQLEAILNRIKTEDLDDVAILVPDESDVMEVNTFLKNKGISTQVHYRTGKVAPFRTVNTLDFSNNDLPCILTYYAAKGSEFDNVFIPFADNFLNSRNAFYVACTRSSRSLYISYSGQITKFLSNVNEDYITKLDFTKK